MTKNTCICLYDRYKQSMPLCQCCLDQLLLL